MLSNAEFSKAYNVPLDIKSIDMEQFALFTVLLKSEGDLSKSGGELWRLHRTRKKTLGDIRKQVEQDRERERQELLAKYIDRGCPFGGAFDIQE